MEHVEINRKTLDLIKSFEGCRLESYKDAAGVWTICYGHTSRAGAPEVGPGMKATPDECERILARDLHKFALQVRNALGEGAFQRLNPNQFGALVSFAYNVGIYNFARSSVLRMVRAGQDKEVPRMLLRWVKARDPRTGRKRTLRGLVRRRRAEGRLYLTPPDRKRPPLVAVARHKGQEMAERPGYMVAITAAAGAIVGTLIGWWHDVVRMLAGCFGLCG